MTPPHTPVPASARDASTDRRTADTSLLLDDGWSHLCRGLASAARIIERDPLAAADARVRATGYRYLLNLLNAGLEQELFSADPHFPEVGHLQDNTKRYASESPDCLFGHCALDPEGTYRVTGRGGSAHYVGFTLYKSVRVYEGFDEAHPTPAMFAAATANTLGSVSHPGGLTLDDDGGFDLIVSPHPHEGNWLPMDGEASRLMIRQYFYDWENEQAHHISVERLDGPGGGPVADPVVVADQLTRIGDFVDRFAGFWDALARSKREGKHNTLVTHPAVGGTYAGDGGYISYGGGHIELAPDEAAIVRFTPPRCHFWNMQLSDYWGESLDYTFRQTSLNGHQASAGSDGSVTVVVSHSDPGVANWLDTAGERHVPMTYRWWLCETADVPTPTLRIVPAARLDEELPAGVPRIGADERRRVLDGRRRAVLRRYQR